MNIDTPRLLSKFQGLKRYMGLPCLYGHTGERYVSTKQCVQCGINAKLKNRRYARRGKPKKSEMFVGPLRPKRKTFKPTNEIEEWIVRSRTNQKKAKFRKGLSVDDYKSIIVTHCPLLGIELYYGRYEGSTAPSNYATLDRIDPSKGYTAGNIQVVSFRANTLKNSSSIEEMRLILSNWEKIIKFCSA
jgi:hypothetical protein